MDEVKDKKQRKILVGVIVVLCVIAVGLGVGIGVKVANDSSEPAGDDLNWSDAQLLYLNFHTTFSEVGEEVDALLSENPVDVEKIRNIYLEKINEAVGLSSYGIAATYEGSAIDRLLAAGLGEEALDMLLSMDVDSYPDLERYYHYERIADLARQLDNEAIMIEYRAKLLELKDVYEQSLSMGEEV